jgi:tetratricopeptide (TPR) repeat protein
LDVEEAARLLLQTGLYLYDRAQYAQAKQLYQEALRIYQKVLPPEHPSTAATIHALASLYQAQGHYSEAEELYQHALTIYEKRLGSDHPSTRIVRTSYEQFVAEAKKRKISAGSQPNAEEGACRLQKQLVVD